MSEGDQLVAGADGDPAYCQTCESPIVLYHDAVSGFNLTCSCPNTSIDVSGVTAEYSVFDSISGRWSQVDEVDAKVDYE